MVNCCLCSCLYSLTQYYKLISELSEQSGQKTNKTRVNVGRWFCVIRLSSGVVEIVVEVGSANNSASQDVRVGIASAKIPEESLAASDASGIIVDRND
jgi:hypothetical protein